MNNHSEEFNFMTKQIEELEKAKSLPSHMVRVVVEKQALDKKHFDLKKFIDIGCPKASEEEKTLLVLQLQLMAKYSDILDKRLNLYPLKLSEKKQSLELIFAITKNKVFGQDGGMPWKCKEDMKHFASTTKDSVLIMGRKTFESLPSPLFGRVIIVVSSLSHTEIQAKNNKVHLDWKACSLEVAIELASITYKHFNKVFVIGGKELIREALPLVDKVNMSVINIECPINENTVVLDFLQLKEIINADVKVFEVD